MTKANDPPDGRHPTSHERMAEQSWDASYQDDSPAPWDIGRPQAAFVRVASEGGFAGDVLDAGCGTGEHALLAASLGLPVLGVDLAETAIALARKKAEERRSNAEFVDARTHSSWSSWDAPSRQCWTAGCSTVSTAMSGHGTWRAWRR